jgi:hypothetical protein
MCVAAAGSAVFAASPVLSSLPVIVISDIENNSTLDNNLFVFTDAFNFTDFATDADEPDQTLLKWSFFVDSADTDNTGSLEINGFGTLATIGDASAPVNPINFSGSPFDAGNLIAGATILESTLSPGGGASAPFATPSEVTPSLKGAPADVDGDSNADKLVGELDVLFLVADSDMQVASQSTFVYTYDTVPFGASVVEDGGLGGFPFVTVPLETGTPGTGAGGAPANGDDGWFFRDWNDRFSAVPLVQPWLEDATSGTTRAVQNSLTVTGAGTGTQNNSFGASTGEWINPGSPSGQFVSGSVYAQRATLAVSANKTSSDSLRVFAQENSVAAINQTYVLNTDAAVDFGSGPINHPFYPGDGVAKQYINVLGPLAADLAGKNDGNPANDVFYLFGFDWIDNIASAAASTASLSLFEVGGVDAVAYNSTETPNPGGGAFGGTGGAAFDGSDDSTYDGWRTISDALVPLPLIGGATILKDPQSETVSAGSIAVVMSNSPINTGADIQFVEYSNFAGDADLGDGTTDVDVVNITADAAYRVDNTLQGLSGATDSLIPDFRMRVAMPVTTFSIEFVVSPSRGNAFPTEGADSVLPIYFVAPTQYLGSADAALVGQEDDLQMAFGPLDNSGTDGTLTLTATRVQLLGLGDPNVDY